VPHTGKRSSIEAAKASTKPIMASHTAAKALFDYIRCKDDETLRAIADTDGMVGVYAYAGLLGGDDNLNTMLDHIDHIVKVIGVDHVGIGTDGCFTPDHSPETFGLRGYENPRFDVNRWWGIWRKNPHTPKNPDESSAGSLAWSNWPLFTVGLVCRGYTDEEIAKIHGQNFLRVMRANGCQA
jgi:membrane dipeptidase